MNEAGVGGASSGASDRVLVPETKLVSRKMTAGGREQRREMVDVRKCGIHFFLLRFCLLPHTITVRKFRIYVITISDSRLD